MRSSHVLSRFLDTVLTRIRAAPRKVLKRDPRLDLPYAARRELAIQLIESAKRELQEMHDDLARLPRKRKH